MLDPPAVAGTCIEVLASKLGREQRRLILQVGVSRFLQEDRGPELADVVLEFIRDNPIGKRQ
jgi:hypothetical protein